jgi:hypothetical protein
MSQSEHTPMTEDESRKQFEAWISGPPFEHHVSRYRSDGFWTGVYMSAQVDLAWQAWQARKTMTDNQTQATTVLQVIRTLCNSPAITDTIWMPNGNVTAVEELCSVAAALGVSEDGIEEATQGNCKQVSA